MSGFVRYQVVSEEMARRAKELRRHQTPAEKALWRALRKDGLQGAHFRRQQVVGGFIVDFYCARHGLVVEVDGPVHQEAETYDALRDELMREAHLTVMRVTNDDVFERMSEVLEKIREALAKKTPGSDTPARHQ